MQIAHILPEGRKQKGPPILPQAPLPRLELAASDTENEHSDDSAGEKEAKRQRSEPTTPVSTSSRQPWEYDAIMGITRVGTKEAERFEEDLDSTEYHDATEEPTRKEELKESQSPPKPVGISGGFGSSSLKECIELLNATVRNSLVPLDSGVSLETTDPPQKPHKSRIASESQWHRFQEQNNMGWEGPRSRPIFVSLASSITEAMAI